jgi:site-specific DNA recombinase
VPAGEIEAAVVDQMRTLFRQSEIVAGTWNAARAHTADITEAEAQTALQQLETAPLGAVIRPRANRP